jgi:hypothetical protein
VYTRTGIIVGAVAGLAVTAVVTALLPRKMAGARPLVGALLGVGVAYLLMRLI